MAVLVPAAYAAPASPTALFRIADPRITEASGIAPGRVSPGVVYVQNDSGDTNRFFALDVRSGATAATVTVPGAGNVDWEDIAVGPGADGHSYVWLADIGDNSAVRREVQVYRVPEPRVPATKRDEQVRTAGAEVWRLRYPTGPVNAESLAVAADGSAYILTKELGRARVFRLPARPDATRVQVLPHVGDVRFAPTGTPNPFGVAGQLTATGATISADGSLLAVRTYADAYVWRLAGGGVAAAVRRPGLRIALPRQQQGEGICVRGGRLLLSSEGRDAPVVSVPVPNDAAPAVSPSHLEPSTSTAAPSRSSPSTRSTASTLPTASSERAGHPTDWWPFGLLAVGAAAALAVTWLVRRRSG